MPRTPPCRVRPLRRAPKKWTKMVHFDLQRSVLVHLGLPTVLWLQPPRTCYRGLSGPSGPKCPGSVLRGVSGAVRALGSAVSKTCPESVPGVSKRCPGHSGDTLGTLFGHSGHPEGHSRDTSGPKGPRDSCSRRGGVAILWPRLRQNRCRNRRESRDFGALRPVPCDCRASRQTCDLDALVKNPEGLRHTN